MPLEGLRFVKTLTTASLIQNITRIVVSVDSSQFDILS